MRTTLDIDRDVLVAARERARLQGRTAGAVLSDLARRGLQAPVGGPSAPAEGSFPGISPLPRRGAGHRRDGRSAPGGARRVRAPLDINVLVAPFDSDHVHHDAAVDLLARARDDASHTFWPADFSVLDVVDPARVHGPRQLTDLHLLGLAVRHGGRLVTFDRSIAWSAVPGAGERDLVVVDG